MPKSICIIGTGGFAREVLCLIDDLGLYDKVACFMEPDHIWANHWRDKDLMGKPVRPMSEANVTRHTACIGVADSAIREKTVAQLPSDIEYISLIHPDARVSRWATIGKGAVVTAGCIITSQISIGDFAQLNLLTTIGHDCVIGDYFTTAPSANISGACRIGRHVYIGTGAGLKQGVQVCDNVTVGMGAMVVKNIEEAGIYVGIPAIKK